MDRTWMNMTLLVSLVIASCVVECHAQGCGATEYRTSAGYVKSMGFPNNYSSGLDCIYNLRSSGQTFLTIFLHTIDLETSTNCQYDSVEISCSQNDEWHKFCELGLTRSVSYPSCSHATIRFRTDGSVTKTGFQIYYIFQRFYSASTTTTTRMPTTTTRRTTLPTTKSTTTKLSTLLSTTEASTVSITATEDSHPTDILSSVARALGPNTSALLVLVLGCLLGLVLLSVIAVFVILKCRSRQSNAAIGMTRSEPCQSTVHYTLDPTAAGGEGKMETNNFRESYMSDNDYVLPDEDDYENADEIATITIGRR